jgi:hypothetical protein
MLNDIQISKATMNDIPFIVDALLYSERSGRDYSFYEKAFKMDESELKELFKKILAENIPGSELCLGNFNILFITDVPVCTLSSWVEGKENPSSNIVKANIFKYFLPKDKWNYFLHAINLISEISINRSINTPQFESVYVEEYYRGKGYIRILLDNVFEYYMNSEYNHVEMISVNENSASMKSFLKCSFQIKYQRSSDNPLIRDVFPGSGKTLWIRYV